MRKEIQINVICKYVQAKHFDPFRFTTPKWEREHKKNWKKKKKFSCDKWNLKRHRRKIQIEWDDIRNRLVLRNTECRLLMQLMFFIFVFFYVYNLLYLTPTPSHWTVPFKWVCVFNLMKKYPEMTLNSTSTWRLLNGIMLKKFLLRTFTRVWQSGNRFEITYLFVMLTWYLEAQQYTGLKFIWNW